MRSRVIWPNVLVKFRRKRRRKAIYGSYREAVAIDLPTMLSGKGNLVVLCRTHLRPSALTPSLTLECNTAIKLAFTLPGHGLALRGGVGTGIGSQVFWACEICG